MALTTEKSKGYCFTINNPTEIDSQELQNLKNEPSVVYLVWGTEIGEEGTLHFQGFVRFKHNIGFRRIKSFLSRAHIEKQRGTCQQAADYCKKDGIYEEHGDLPISAGSKTKEMWKNVIKWAEEGEVEKIKDEYPHIYFLHKPKILALRSRHSGILSELVNEWWVGPTGTGKSRRLWAEFPEHYPKQLNKWWDGYDNEEVVAIEEMTPAAGQFLAHYLKIWADRYPFSPEIKGSTLKKIRPKKVIVLSNYTIDECFEKDQDILPLKRRFKVVQFEQLW
uniref:Replication-associated protein n=1 Tax=Cressdnaviricota sp. TaxID=2748378 RepID=A0A890UZY9_9VIRU|nr:MAG: replication-associated protein [Cressdnaviricota sp.]